MAVIKQAKTSDFKLGLEVKGRQFFDNTTAVYPIPRLNKKWLHGLNEDQVKKVEKDTGRSFTNPSDNEFWGGLEFEIDHNYDFVPTNDWKDVLKIGVLKNLGVLAGSLEEVRNNPNANYGYVLSDPKQEVQEKLTLTKKKYKAIEYLMEIKDSSYLLYFAKYVLPKTLSLNEDEELAFQSLSEFIEGEIKERQGSTIKENLAKFQKAREMEKEDLILKVDIEEALKFNLIRLDKSKMYTNPLYGHAIGRNFNKVFEYFKDPKNQEELGLNMDTDNEYSLRYQLKIKRRS